MSNSALLTELNKMIADAGLNSIPGIIAATALISAIFVSFTNNFWTNKMDKRKQSHEKIMQDAKNVHELNFNRMQKYQEAKIQAINDFMASTGEFFAFKDENDSRIKFLASYTKVLPYLNIKTVEIVNNLVNENDYEKSKKLIFELAKSLHDNDLKI